jgi:aminopeptidase N
MPFEATSDVIHQAQFALDVKAKVLPLYEKIFDIEYPLPKLDTLIVGSYIITHRVIDLVLIFSKAHDFDAGEMHIAILCNRT